MTIPVLPTFFRMPYTTVKGRLTPQANAYNDQTFQTLNQLVALVNFTIGSGYVAVDNGSTAFILAAEPNAPVGAVWFNTTIKKLQVKTDTGVIETITSV